jgi:hypothetical protein
VVFNWVQARAEARGKGKGELKWATSSAADAVSVCEQPLLGSGGGSKGLRRNTVSPSHPAFKSQGTLMTHLFGGVAFMAIF